MSFSKFVMVARPRTGSTFLHMRLISHPQIVAYGEMFHPSEAKRKKDAADRKFPVLQFQDNPIRFLETYIYKSYPKVKAIGFKLFYDHARNSEWLHVWDYVRDQNIKVIHLKRKNLLDTYLSLQLAYRSNKWVQIEKSKSNVQMEPITLDPDDCLQFFHKTARQEHLVDSFFQVNQLHQVTYEDLTTDIEKVSNRVLAFLNVPNKQLRTRTVKQQTLARSRAIANFAALKKHIADAVAAGKAQQSWLSFFYDEEVN